MRVFLSWSGPKSLQLARLLNDWIPLVLQSVSLFFSEELDKGIMWSTKIAFELREADFGIICVTSENVFAPWLNFEAGALANALERRMSPLLLDVEKSEITGPLAQYNLTHADRDDIFRLLSTLNISLAKPLSDIHLSKAFNSYWDEFRDGLEAILASHAPVNVVRTTDEKIDEILAHVRAQTSIAESQTKYSVWLGELQPRDRLDRLRSNPPPELKDLLEREWHIAIQLARGQSMAAIAESFGVTRERIKANALRAARNLGVKGTRALAARFNELSLRPEYNPSD